MPKKRLKKSKILVSIIEDDASMRSALASLVGSHAYLVSEHISAEDFLASKELPTTSCIISDIQMPGLDGFGLITALNLRASNVPVILITANTDKTLSSKALERGAICLLQKPFDADLLMAHLSRALKEVP